MPKLDNLKTLYHTAADISSAVKSKMDHKNYPSGYPNMPPSLSSNFDFEPTDRKMGYDEMVHHNTVGYYTPYLGLRARLSQVWINKWTILLLLILVRVLLAVQGLDHDISNAKVQALSACTSVENVGSAMASMPHYMSTGVNQMAAKGIEVAVGALYGTLTLVVTGVEEIVLFIINMLVSTYVCLITLVVGGAMSAALDVVDKAGQFLNRTLGAVTGEISQGMAGFQNEMNDFLGTIGDISGFFGGSREMPTIDLTSEIAKINNISLDADALSADLDALQAKIPQFEDVKNFTDSLIRTPFEAVKQLINESNSGYQFDRSVFPIAEKQALSFCSDNNGINSFFDGLADTANVAKKVFIGVIIALALLACIPMAWREIQRWRTMQQRAAMIKDQSLDSLDVIYMASRPYTASAGLKIGAKFNSTKKRILARWWVAYITSIPALFVLLLGIAGLISCLFQYILLKQVEAKTPELAAQVGEFTGDVVLALTNASEQWAVGANSVVDATNSEINTEIFGWVNTTTTSVNDTLNSFVDGVQDVLNDTFGGTPLETPIRETLRCLIFLKIEGIQRGLTWVKENAKVAFPPFDGEVFSLGAAAELDDSGESSSFLSSPGSEATDDITGAVLKLIGFLKDAIETEVYISLALIGVWLLICLVGGIRVAVALMDRDKTRAEGGPSFGTSTSYASNLGAGQNHTYMSERNVFPRFGSREEETPAVPRARDQFVDVPLSALNGFGSKMGFAKDKESGNIGRVTVGSASRVRNHERKSSYGIVGEKI